METLPAIIIGGPPHSGKSVLTYSLSQALRRKRVAHYVLRTAPDGEGDWFNEAHPDIARTLRYKREFSPEFVDHMCQSLANRHLPLLVDAGGKPTPDQERIFDFCTHAILLTRDDETHTFWLDLVQRHSLPLIADLTSRLDGESVITDKGPVLRGIITRLERNTVAQGPVFEALLQRVTGIFAYDEDELRLAHHHMVPAKDIVVVDVDRILYTLGIIPPDQQHQWRPEHLPRALKILPSGQSLALYGRAPNWVYAALALHAHPASFYQFDPRLGWITPPTLQHRTPPLDAPLQARVLTRPDHLRIEFTLTRAYLDYSDARNLAIPPVPSDRGLVLSGKLPHWLWTALALAYHHVPWLAVYQPQVEEQAPVVHSRATQPQVGTLIASPP